MSTFDLAKAWAPYESLMPTRDMALTVRAAVEFAREPMVGIVPSLHLLPDGIRIGRLFFFTAHLLCDVTVDGMGFDFVDRLRVYNLRWRLGTVDMKGADGATIDEYETATLQIHHVIGSYSMLEYVGKRRAEWISSVLAMMPSRAVVKKWQEM